MVPRDHAFAGEGNLAGDHQSEVLLGRAIGPTVDILEYPLGPDSEDPFAGGGIADPNALDVVDPVAIGRVGYRLAIQEGVAPEDTPIGGDHLQVQIVDQGRDGGGQSRNIGVGEGDLQRIVSPHDESFFRDAPRFQPNALVGEIEAALPGDERGHIATPPPLIIVWNRGRAADHQHGAGLFVVGVHGYFSRSHVHGRIDERGLHQSRRRRQPALGLPVPLHEHRTGTAHMRPCLGGSALEHVVLVDPEPGIGVAGKLAFERGDPGARSGDVGFDAAVFRRTAAGEISHGLGSLCVDRQIESVVLAGSGGDHILGHSRCTDGLLAGSRIAGAEFENVGLFPGSLCIGVPHQRVEFGGTEVVAPLRVVAPGVGSHVGAAADGVSGQHFIAGRRIVIAGSVKESLGHQVRSGSHAQTPEVTVVILGADGTAAGHDPGAVCAVAVLVGGVLQAPVGEEGIHPSVEVLVHGLGFTRVEAGVGDGYRDPASIEAQFLDFGRLARGAVIAHQDLGGDLVHQLHSARGLDPQHRLRSRHLQDLSRTGLAAQKYSEVRLGEVDRSSELTEC